MNYVYLSIFLGVALVVVSVLLVMCYNNNTPRQMTNDYVRNQITADLNTKQFPNLTKDDALKIANCLIKNFPTLTQVVNNNRTLHTLFVNIIGDKQCRGRFPRPLGPVSASAPSPSPPPVCEKYFAKASFIEQQLILEYLIAIGVASNMTDCTI